MVTIENISIEQLGQIQESLSPECIYSMRWDRDTQSVILPEQCVPEFMGVKDIIDSGDAPAGSDYESLLGRIAALENALLASRPLEDNDTFSMKGVARRKWIDIENGQVEIGADNAGRWQYHVFVTHPNNGRGIGLQVLKNDEVWEGTIADGSSYQGDTNLTVSFDIDTEDGDVLRFQVNHNLASKADLDGHIRGIRLVAG